MDNKIIYCAELFDNKEDVVPNMKVVMANKEDFYTLVGKEVGESLERHLIKSANDINADTYEYTTEFEKDGLHYKVMLKFFRFKPLTEKLRLLVGIDVSFDTNIFFMFSGKDNNMVFKVLRNRQTLYSVYIKDHPEHYSLMKRLVDLSNQYHELLS